MCLRWWYVKYHDYTSRIDLNRIKIAKIFGIICVQFNQIICINGNGWILFGCVILEEIVGEILNQIRKKTRFFKETISAFWKEKKTLKKIAKKKKKTVKYFK